jgi:uncharacterized protein YqeY
MSLDEKLGEDLKTSMKAKDALKTGVLRLLKTRVKEASVAKRDTLSDDEIYKVIISEAKKRKEAIELFEQGGRGDLAAREKQEIEVLESYLPPKLTDEELKTIVAEAITEADAKDPRDLGKVMKVLMPKVTGRSDGSKVSRMVKDLLAGGSD